MQRYTRETERSRAARLSLLPVARVGAGALAALHAGDDRHVVVVERDVVEVEVLTQALGMRRLDDGGSAELQMPAQHHLRDRDGVLRRDGEKGRVIEQAAAAERAPRLRHDAEPGVQGTQLVLGQPRVRLDLVQRGCDIMGYAPTLALKKLFAQTGLTPAEVSTVELSEAFASQALAVIRDTGLDPEKTNPYGGAIALGHPVGATGAILTVRAALTLQRTGGEYAIVTMCIGGGQALAALLKRG